MIRTIGTDFFLKLNQYYKKLPKWKPYILSVKNLKKKIHWTKTQAMWTFSIEKWIVKNEKTHVNHKEIVVLLS